jgi:hypothetical protein
VPDPIPACAGISGGLQVVRYGLIWPIVLKKLPKTGKEPIRFEIVTKKSNKNKAENISVYG